ncbi:hypothetical protein Tco_1370647 [Tanacetum coccineum]
MNPDSGDMMKHRTMLRRSSQVNFKERVTRSSSKKGDLVVDMDGEGCDEGNLGVGDGSSVVDKPELIFGSIGKDSKVSHVSKGIYKGIDMPEVDVNYVNTSDVHMNGNRMDSNGVSPLSSMPDMPVPFAENPILNPENTSSDTTSGRRVILNEVKIHGMFKVVGDGSMLNKGIGSVSNFEVGQQSGVMGSDLSRNGGLKQSLSFASAVSKSFGVFGNNKLKFVSTTFNNEGREVAVIDSVLEEGIDKWSMTVMGHFVGFQMGYREIVGHLKRMWRLYAQSVTLRIDLGGENKPLFVASRGNWWLCMSKLSNVFVGNVNGDHDGWQNVDYRRGNRNFGSNSQQRSYNGYNGRGYMGYRGSNGFNNRGRSSSGVDNGAKNSSVKYVPVKSNEKVVTVDECLVADEVAKEVSNADIGSSANKGSSDNGLGKVEVNGKVNDTSVKESILVEEVSLKNRFEVLNEDDVDGVPIVEDEMKGWSVDMVQLYEKKWKTRLYADKSPSKIRMIKLMESLNYKIGLANRSLHINAKATALKLVKDSDEAIGERRKVEVDLFILSKRPLVDDIKDIWTDDMMEYFLDRCEEVKNDEKNGHYADDGVFDSMEEVGDDTSGSASFLSQNEVVNGIDTSMAQMQGGLADHPSNLQ